MATSRTTRSSGPVMLSISAGFRRSMSPSGRFHSGGSRRESSPSASSFASSSFSSPLPSPFFHQRSASPTRVNLVGSVNASGSVRFATSSRSIESPVVRKNPVAGGRQQPQQRRTCMCSPTTHPGSFRCALHKNSGFHHGNRSLAPSHRLNARRSAMTNSLVRIGTVEGDLVKRALAALIRPSSHQQRRRGSFQPRPSRLSVMSKAGDDYHLS